MRSSIVFLLLFDHFLDNISAYQDISDLYAEDVQLISKDGKIYYLPTEKTE